MYRNPYDDEGGPSAGSSRTGGSGPSNTGAPRIPNKSADPSHVFPTKDDGSVNGGGPDVDIDFDKAFGMQRNPYTGKWTDFRPDDPGSFGSVGSGGRGGRGMVDAVGSFDWTKPPDAQDYSYDQFTEQYSTPKFTEQYSSEAFTPEGRFEAPNEALDFREFNAPTEAEAISSPGYQFRLAEGQRALENAAAAKGMLRTGNTWKDLLRYGQGAATSEYDKTYGRRRAEHDLAYQQARQQNQDQYGRALNEQQLAYQQGANTYGLNRQRDIDMYDRSFQKHQANQALDRDVYDRSFQRHGANQMGLTQAQRLSEQSGLSQYDRTYQGEQAGYGYDLQRAMHESGLAESAASRAQSASAANVAGRERAYNRSYQRAADEYRDKYEGWEADDSRRWDRYKWYNQG